MSGDLVTSSASAMESAKKNFKSEEGFEVSAYIPDPVFFCSIEAPSPVGIKPKMYLKKYNNDLKC